MAPPKAVLQDEGSPAIALLAAVEQAAPGAVMDWEPEALWLELERSHIDVPLANRARIGAAIAILAMPAFYWDAVVFEKTALSFDGRPPHPDILEEASPAQMAWAVVEAAWIRKRWGHHSIEFRHEPTVYTAAVLHRDGFVRAPEQLAFAQSELRRLNGADDGLLEEVERKLREGAGSVDSSFEETPVGVQLARLTAVRLHVEERRRAAEERL